MSELHIRSGPWRLSGRDGDCRGTFRISLPREFVWVEGFGGGKRESGT